MSYKAYVSLKHEVDKVIVYERAGVLFIFNFHPTRSFSDYRVGVEEAGKYMVVLSSDDKQFGGFDRVDASVEHFTTPMEWNNRKNWLQVRGASCSVRCQRLIHLACYGTGVYTYQDESYPRTQLNKCY